MSSRIPIVQAILDVRKGERAAVAWSIAYFFLVLFGYGLLKPIRDELNVGQSDHAQARMFILVMIAMFIANPIYTFLAASLPRRIFVPLTYGGFACGLLAFMLLWNNDRAARPHALNEAFFVYVSVYNLFINAIFWSVMADLWTTEQSKRVFPLIGVGGTLGFIAASKVVSLISTAAAQGGYQLQTGWFFIASAACLILLLGCLWRLARLGGILGGPRSSAVSAKADEPGPGAFKAMLLAVTRPYLIAVSLYIVLLTVTSTVLYNQRNSILAAHFETTDARRAILADIEIWQQSITLFLQCFVSSLLIRRLGIGLTLAALPILTFIGFGVLGFTMQSSAGLAANVVLWTFIMLTISRTGFQHALSRPSREILFTGVSQADRYAAKTFIDTVVYRAGDAGAMSGIAALRDRVKIADSAFLFWCLPLAGVWVALSMYLGAWQKRSAHRAAQVHAA